MRETDVLRPQFTLDQAEGLALSQFGVSGRIKPLPSDSDQNFLIRESDDCAFVLKIANGRQQREILNFQNAMLRHLSDSSDPREVPKCLPAKNGDFILTCPDSSGRTYFTRLLSFLPGKRLVDVQPHGNGLLLSLGERLAHLDKSLLDFSHAAASRSIVWDVARASSTIRAHIEHIESAGDRQMVMRFLERYEISTAPLLSGFRRSVIHGDANDHNVLVHESLDGQEVVSIIDFGDAVFSHTINDVAIACAYALLSKPDPVVAASHIIAGYNSVLSLTEVEIAALFDLICMRLCISVCMSSFQKEREPDNDYLTTSEQPAWRALQKLSEIPVALAEAHFRHACGLKPCPEAQKLVSWLTGNRQKIGNVVEPALKTSNSLILDLSVGSLQRDHNSQSMSTQALSDWVFGRIQDAGAEVGIGRYNEARQVYSGEQFQQADGSWRTIHIGMDIFLPAGTRVFAPLRGRVHSFQNNDSRLDYGPTIILEHQVDKSRLTFYTLYGHLSPDSLAGLTVGANIERGDEIARIGSFPENGDWPPHLHFQVITDMLEKAGDFPGVAPAASREVWLSLCPDPNLILQAPTRRFPASSPEKAEILASREKHLSKSLSVSYRHPLKIVRGYMQYLYDEAGRAYLDAVNNVPHVGHCNPRVVAAAQKQMAVLNTNTRYLHDNLVSYAQRLTATFPDPLNVCFLVNSGSEANELALRLARAHTGRRDFLVVDGAYHGNTGSVVELSPYKFDGPGGAGSAAHIHKVPTPDTYRGRFKAGDADAGTKYAARLESAILRMQMNRRKPAAFFCESVLSCAGQIVLPAGYLQACYRYVRQAGGLCVADEVQVGFGRVGSHFWAFETQGVVPDIVTLGKPIGNGHPLAAVVTTQAIAESFANGMEYFNTFGGNPVSCAIGMAVMEELESGNLQDNAHQVGNYLLTKLRALTKTSGLVGEVRGLGLFIGIEFVKGHDSLEPAAAEASYIVERMKSLGVLLSTDGPLHNVIKIKPPMVFSKENADTLANTLAEVLQDSCLQDV